MKKSFLLKTMLLLCALVVGVSGSWGQSDVYTSNITLSTTSGSNASEAKVRMSSTGTQYDAIKLGTSSKSGYAFITVPAGTKTLHIHCAGWNGDGASRKLNLTTTANGVTITPASMSLINDNGISSSTPFTLSTPANASTSYYASFTLTGVNTNTQIKLETSSKRAVYWGVNAEVGITSIAFPDPKTATIGAGGTVTLTPTILPITYNETVDWESDATDVATVNSSGVVTGVAAGTAHITAKAHNNPTTIYDVCTVTVTAAVPVTGVSLKSSTTLLLGDTETLEATFLPADATNKNVTWSSADDTKVSVDENGVITGLALTNDTPVIITVTTEDGDYTATCAVTVNPVPVTGVELDKTTATLRVGKKLTLNETVSPDNATNKSVTWESDDTSVATVNDGEVTAVAVGSAKITVKSVADPTKMAECTITVVEGNIQLSAGDVLIFNDFSGAGNSYGSGTKTTDFTADDGNDYEWSGSNYMSSSGLQLKASGGTITSPTVKAPNGYKLEITRNSYVVDVYINNVKQTPVSNDTWELPNNTAFTFTNNTGNAAKITKVTITALKQYVATEVAITDPGTLAKDATGMFAYTATTEESNTKAWTSSDASVIEIKNATTGAYEAKGHGTAKITLTLNPTDATNYREVSAELNVNVTEPVVVSANDVTMTYGDAAKAIGATTSTDYAGTLSYQSGNTNIATVDESGNVTAVAAGTTTITISAPADPTNLYTAGEDVEITVTVNEPTGKTTSTNVEEDIEELDMATEYVPSTWTMTTTNDGNFQAWTNNNSNDYISANGYYNSNRYAGTYDYITDEYDFTDYVAATLTISHACRYFGSTISDGMKLFAKIGDTEQELTINTYPGNSNINTYVTNTTDLTSLCGKKAKIIFRYVSDGANTNTGRWDIKYFKITGEKVPTTNVTVAASGFGSFCYQYPLDLDLLDEEVKAYIVTNASEGNVTFKQITGTIRGGVPFILYGEPGNYTLYTASSSTNVPEINMLKGTLSPKYITTVEGDYTNFGLSGGKFVKINNGNLPANKAYLPILTSVVEGSTGAPTFDIIFDEGTTGVENVNRVTMNDNKYYTLDGRRVENPTKGLYIVNGKKVMIK